MPRNVRNFWLELTVDGASRRIETGPRSKEGGFTLNILMRDKGGIVRAGHITGRATATGILFINAEFKTDGARLLEQQEIIRVQTER